MVGYVTVSDRAAEKIRQLLGGTSQENGLRLKVVAGGCSGFEYKMAVDARAAEDWVLEKNGARIFLDPNSDEILRKQQSLTGLETQSASASCLWANSP